MNHGLRHFSRYSGFAACLTLHAAAFAGFVSPVAAQVTSRPVREGSRPVGVGSGPVSEMSTNVGAGGGPVFGDGSVRDGGGGRLGGNPVRGSITGDLSGGPVSDGTVGSVATRLPPAVSVVPPAEYFPQAQGQQEMVPQEEPAAPVYDLQPLADRLRGVRPLPRDAAADEQEPAPEEQAAAPDDQDDVENPREEARPPSDEEPPPAEEEPAPEQEEPAAETP